MDEAQRNVDYWDGVKNAGQETAQGMAPAQDATNGAAPVDAGTETQNVGQAPLAPSTPVVGNAVPGEAVDAEGDQRASLRRKRQKRNVGSVGFDNNEALHLSNGGMALAKGSVDRIKKLHQNQPASSDKGQQDLTTGSTVDNDAKSGAKILISKESVKLELDKVAKKYAGVRKTKGFLSDLVYALGDRSEKKKRSPRPNLSNRIMPFQMALRFLLMKIVALHLQNPTVSQPFLQAKIVNPPFPTKIILKKFLKTSRKVLKMSKTTLRRHRRSPTSNVRVSGGRSRSLLFQMSRQRSVPCVTR